MATKVVEIRAATIDDALAIIPKLRQADIEEAEAMTGNNAAYAVLMTARASDGLWMGIIDGEPVCIFGIVPRSILEGKGIPWMVGTSLLEKNAKQILFYSKLFLQHALKQYKILENYVDARNEKSIRWLRWMGFKIGQAEPFGPYRRDFHPFSMVRGE